MIKGIASIYATEYFLARGELKSKLKVPKFYIHRIFQNFSAITVLKNILTLQSKTLLGKALTQLNEYKKSGFDVMMKRTYGYIQFDDIS